MKQREILPKYGSGNTRKKETIFGLYCTSQSGAIHYGRQPQRKRIEASIRMEIGKFSLLVSA
ncbi:hypothetical protein ACQJ0Y_16960 [Peribacillus simplex]|uniref:hypothetical protein n=1 Tax=Peribacillus simplex TaxID=1478 RepID=UPI003CE76986